MEDTCVKNWEVGINGVPIKALIKGSTVMVTIIQRFPIKEREIQFSKYFVVKGKGKKRQDCP